MIAADPPRVSRIEFKDGGDRSGLVVREDGRLAIIGHGTGLSVQLDAARMLGFGQRCIKVAALLAERERAAAEAAGADLSRVASAGSFANDG